MIAWLGDPNLPQRDKLATLRATYIETIRALDDTDHATVVREIKKRLKSPKLAAELAALMVALTKDRVANPRPVPPAAPETPPIAPVIAPTRDAHALLEAAIAADPEKRDSYLVYGDWLASQGNPHGELVTIGAELAKNPGNKAMLAAHRQHLVEHAGAILGRIADCEDLVTDVEWHLGFIRACRVASTSERFNGDRPNLKITDVLGWLLDEPGPGRFLQRLVVGIVQHDGNTYQGVGLVLAQKVRPSLRTLVLGDFSYEETELNWSTIGDVSDLWPAVPNLRDLSLRSGSMDLGPIDLPKLERLATITGGLDPVSARHIAEASWPALEVMSLQLGRGGEGAVTDVNVFDALLAGTKLPKLRSLGLTNQELGDELCQRLVTAKIVPQLEELDLSMSTMTDAGARILHANAAKFQHLARINVDQNYLTPAGVELLQGVAKTIITHEQRTEERGYRQALAYE